MPASRLLGDARLDPGVLITVILAGGAYLAGVRTAARWASRRTAAFLGGLVVVLLASQSGLDAWSERLLSIHMVAHLLILAVAAPLLAAGAPVSLALRALPRRGRDGLVRLLATRVVGRLTHPVGALSVFSFVLLATHVPAAYDLALGDPALHALEHAVYLWAGLLFWAPVVAVDPLPDRLSAVGAIGYLLVAMIPMSAIGAWLISTGAVAYSPYLAPARRLGVSALGDQHAAAVIMWLGGTLVLVAATLAAAWAALLREERRARVREERADRAAAAVGRPR